MTKNHSARKGANIQGTRKRRQLLEAAGKAFANGGYAGTTIRDIAEIANVQPSALIYHFDNKENLFRATLRYHIIENANLEKSAKNSTTSTSTIRRLSRTRSTRRQSA